VNALTLVALLSQLNAVTAQNLPDDVVRARTWELVDGRGQIRASMEIAPEGDVVLRLRDRTGTIRVKLSAGETGSGLLLLDNTTEPGVQLGAGASGSSLKLTNRDGRQNVIQP
jgi:hypothetical protein